MTIATTLATSKKDASGAVFQYKNSDDEYVTLPGIQTIPQIGTNDSYEDATDIDADELEYMAQTLPEEAELELVLDDQPGNSVQSAFTDKVIARTEIECMVTRMTGRTETFTFIPQNHYSGESAKGSSQKFACIGKIRSLNFGTVA
jgi:hypothetical protein